MNTTDFMDRVPPTLREQFAQYTLKACDQPGDNTEIIASPLVIEHMYENFSALEKQTLAAIMKTVGCSAFSIEHIEKNCERYITGAQLKVGIVHLRQKGVIFTLKKSWGEYIHFIPTDAFRHWHRLLFPFHVHDSAALFESNGLVKQGLACNLLRLFVAIGSDGLLLKKDGTVPKKQMEKIMEQMDLTDADFVDMELNYTHKGAYSVSFAVLLDIALRLRVVIQTDQRLELHPVHLQWWLSQSMDSAQHQLYLLWRQIRMPRESWIQHVIFAIEQQPSDVWISVSALWKWLEQAGIRYPLEQEALAFLQSYWLGPLQAMGWLECGTSLDGEMACRWMFERDSSSQDSLPSLLNNDDMFVQPDFDVLVPPTVPLVVRWELELVADFVKADRLSLYRITKDKIGEAMENGRTSDEIVEFFAKHAKYGVPHNVQQCIEDWGKQFGNITITEVMLLQCKYEHVADMLGQDAQFAPYFLSRIGPAAFVIRREWLKELSDRLDKSGLSPKFVTLYQENVAYMKCSHVEITETACISKSLTRSFDYTSGLVVTHQPVPQLEIAAEIPEIRDLFPKFDEIPVMWMNEYRHYHSSTRKQLLQCAIDLKTEVKLKCKGQDITFRPKVICEGRHSWEVNGMCNGQEICLQPELWEEMQLILPGINDNN